MRTSMTASVEAMNSSRRPANESPRRSVRTDVSELRRPLSIGLVLSGVIAVAVFGWGGLASLSGAVVAPGVVVVDGNSKKIQHPQGGVIGQILVRDGSRVSAGDLLVKLDDTQLRASLGVV